MSRHETGSGDFIVGAARYMCAVRVRLVGCSSGYWQGGGCGIAVGGIGVGTTE